jgi:hypothetical protein
VRGEYGYGEPAHFSTVLTKNTGGLPLNLNYTSVKIGSNVYDGEVYDVDVMAGPFLALPSKHASTAAAGIILTPRVVGGTIKGLRPFVAVDLGLGWFDWEPQSSDFNFVVGGGPGFMVDVANGVTFTLSTSIFHVSNAQTSRPNPGFNSDLVLFGLEFEL